MPRSCPICGSKKWRRDAISGSAICEDGHVFQDYRSENLVIEAAGYSLQKRAVKKGPRRNRRKEKGDVNLDYYKGDDAEYLKVQALQLLLRLQSQALAKLWSLPEVFEMIVRDLWAYHLVLMQLPPSPRPDSNPNDADRDNASGAPPEEPLSGEDKSDKEGSEGSKSDDQLDVAADAEVELEQEVMAQLSVTSSEEDSQNDSSVEMQIKGDVRWKRNRRFQAADTIVTLVVALWILRVPFMIVDVENLINENRIPYLDFGNMNLVPTEMKRHMNGAVTVALSPKASPSPLFIHTRCYALVRRLKRHYEIEIPEFNIIPVSWRIISGLGGTPTTYHQVMRLLALLDVNLALNTTGDMSIKKKMRRRNDVDGNPHDDDLDRRVEYLRAAQLQNVWMPEVLLAMALVMVMKMAYGLDGEVRHALIRDDPIIDLPECSAWLSELHGKLQNGAHNQSTAKLSKLDFTGMDLDDIDCYLDDCERVLLKDHNVIDNSFFPLPPSTGDSSSTLTPLIRPTYRHWKGPTVQPSSISTNMPNKKLPFLPGEDLRNYDPDDTSGTLPHECATLLRSCAAFVGVEEEHLSKCVAVHETKLEKIRLARLDRVRRASGQISRSGSRLGRLRKSKSAGGLRVSTGEAMMDDAMPVTP